MAPRLPQSALTATDEDLEDTDLREDLEVDPPEEEEEDIAPQKPVETEIERQARALGWHPKEEYLGDPSKWMPAKQFMERGERILPIMRDNNRRLLERVDKQNSEMEGMKKSLDEQREVLQEMRERLKNQDRIGYERGLAEAKRAQREAAATGDMEAFDRLGEQIDKMVKLNTEVQPPKKTEPPPQPEAPKLKPEVADFIRRNAWFNTDMTLQKATEAEHVRLLEEEPELSLAENLERAKEAVMARYPAKFGRPNGTRTSQPPRTQNVHTPTGGNARATNRPKGTPIDQIEDPRERAEAKEAFRKWQTQIPGFTEEEYMATYNDPHADILSVRRGIREKRNAK